MKTINFDFNQFNLENFIKDYDSKVRLLFEINNDEPLGRIIEVLEHNTLQMKLVQEAYTNESMIEKLANEEIAIFMPLAITADKASNYIRLINMCIYRIHDNEFSDLYNNSNLFEIKSDVLNIGDLKVSNDSAIGVVISRINKKVFISFAQYECGSCMNGASIKVKANAGDLHLEIEKYLNSYSR